MYRDLVTRTAILSVVLMTLAVFTESASASRFTYGNPGFCAPEKPVRDFGLSSLPPVREVPESAKPLGYGAVNIYGGWSHVMPAPSSFGYGFSEHSYTEEGVLLNWTVTAQLWTINKRGEKLREVDDQKLFIRRLRSANQPNITVDPLENRRGFYRFDMQIENLAGRVIGSYGAYFRVVRRSWGPRLRLSHDVVRPGQRLLIRPENYGSETVSYVEPFSVQRFEGGRWIRVPDLTPGRWLKWLGLLGPGGIGRCNMLWLPPDTPPGQYLVSKRMGTDFYPEGKTVTRTAPFEVLAPGTEIEYKDAMDDPYPLFR